MFEGREVDRDVETRILLLDTPFGGEPHLRERDRAAAWLVEHADRAFPILLARLIEGKLEAGAIALLPRFGRAESIAPLARLLEGPEGIAWEAGQALAQHPQPEAGEALRHALASSDPVLATIAADALARRGDNGDCAILIKRLSTTHSGLRFHVLQAAALLDCLSREVISELAEADPNPDVRNLATKLLTPAPARTRQ